MSLTNVLLIHVSSRYMPRTDAEEQQEQEKEYYHLLGLPKYSPVTEIRKSYRRLTLQIQCDRMMLEWNSEDEDHTAAKAALDEKELHLKEAFHVLGDKHLRQQYHLLQCRPSRYKIIKGPLALIHALTQSRRWFPLLVLQSVIV
jgi:preprotein translocase subunit Sec63